MRPIGWCVRAECFLGGKLRRTWFLAVILFAHCSANSLPSPSGDVAVPATATCLDDPTAEKCSVCHRVIAAVYETKLYASGTQTASLVGYFRLAHHEICLAYLVGAIESRPSSSIRELGEGWRRISLRESASRKVPDTAYPRTLRDCFDLSDMPYLGRLRSAIDRIQRNLGVRCADFDAPLGMRSNAKR